MGAPGTFQKDDDISFISLLSIAVITTSNLGRKLFHFLLTVHHERM